MTRTVRTYSNSSDEPRYFAKAGHSDQNPNSVKKNGHGRCNWGAPGDEVEDVALSGEFNFSNARRRSNSMSRSQQAKEIRPPQFESTMAEEEEELEAFIEASKNTDEAQSTTLVSSPNKKSLEEESFEEE
ncbi:uncharacterized protein SAPINGB_P003846 [Magnusiomyces paraingens]|uniref:Hyaluronan/mRNA-binding protein domain-containing protein n=1 Tax=Magnusiomyces paraingens TaxID=2606893 RepID=A0A5E8BTN7_9ASCO|nr:uncharacterized protein SAPINGB_P003846 [Saprochaete ingens]VVT53979.1 unnamed protein product [Saprochaete ingens]